MQTKPRNIIVLMHNNSLLEVTYYCTDTKLNAKEKEKFTQLFIQLYDCVCSMKIDKTICPRKDELERIVHNKVMNAKGHLC